MGLRELIEFSIQVDGQAYDCLRGLQLYGCQS